MQGRLAGRGGVYPQMRSPSCEELRREARGCGVLWSGRNNPVEGGTLKGPTAGKPGRSGDLREANVPTAEREGEERNG